MNQRNFEAQILLGKPVPSSELEAYTRTVAALLGPPGTTLNVQFVEREPDLSLLSDTELAELERLMAIARRESPPSEPPKADPGPAEIAARALGQYVDAHRDSWRTTAPTSAEQEELRDLMQRVVGDALIIHQLWRDAYANQLKSESAPAAPEPEPEAETPAPDNVVALPVHQDPPASHGLGSGLRYGSIGGGGPTSYADLFPERRGYGRFDNNVCRHM